jgi:very-short-patch-repair endonuclease
MSSPTAAGRSVKHHSLKERWTSVLRGQMRSYGIASPALREEHRFHATRKFLFDFAIPHLRIAIEVEGGVFMRPRPGRKSRHTSGAGYQRDCTKYNLAALDGWTVLRFTSRMIERCEAIDTIREAVRRRETARKDAFASQE